MSRLYNKTRKQNNRVSKPVIYVATEGTVTEPQYFKKLKDLAKDFVSIQVVDSRSQTHCDPKSVLKRLKNELKSKDSFESRDRAWVVIDRDKWTKAAFNTLLDWEALDPRHGVALSNPKFEYWLLAHFENPSGVTTPSECDAHLKKHIPSYAKKINQCTLSLDQFNDAIKRCKTKVRTTQECINTPGSSTVYKLVDQILQCMSKSS